MSDTSTGARAGIDLAPHAFAWIFADPSASLGPMTVPLEELTQRHWDLLVGRLPREARRRMRVALEKPEDARRGEP